MDYGESIEALSWAWGDLTDAKVELSMLPAIFLIAIGADDMAQSVLKLVTKLTGYEDLSRTLLQDFMERKGSDFQQITAPIWAWKDI